MGARLTAVLAALLLAVGALAACTGDWDYDDPAEATATATRTPTPRPRPTAIPIPTPESAEVAADRAVLVAIYHAKGGEGWYEPWKTKWLSAAPLGEWSGVTTDGDGRVTELVLLVGMTGPIPPELSSLTRLERLVLGGVLHPDGRVNYLSGPIVDGQRLCPVIGSAKMSARLVAPRR